MYTTYHRQIRVIVAVNPSRSRLLPSVHHLLLRLLDLYLRRPASRKTKLLTLVTPSYLAAPLPSCSQPICQPSTIAKVLSLSRFDKAQKLIFIRGWKSRGQIGFGHTALGPSARTPLNYVVRGKRRSGQGRIFGGWEGAPRAWLLIEQTSTRRLCRQERYSPFFLGCAGWVLKISFIRGIVVRISYFFFFIRFLLTVVSKPLKDSLHQRDIFFRYTYFYLNFKKIVDLISTERRIALLTFQVRHCSRCLVAFSPTPAFSPFSSGFHLSKWRRISDVPLEFEAIAMISIRKFRRYRTG